MTGLMSDRPRDQRLGGKSGLRLWELKVKAGSVEEERGKDGRKGEREGFKASLL